MRETERVSSMQPFKPVFSKPGKAHLFVISTPNEEADSEIHRDTFSKVQIETRSNQWQGRWECFSVSLCVCHIMYDCCCSAFTPEHNRSFQPRLPRHRTEQKLNASAEKHTSGNDLPAPSRGSWIPLTVLITSISLNSGGEKRPWEAANSPQTGDSHLWSHHVMN